MYERLTDKKVKPETDELKSYIGSAVELFEHINSFLINEIDSEVVIKFDAHSSCWKFSYHKKKIIFAILLRRKMLLPS